MFHVAAPGVNARFMSTTVAPVEPSAPRTLIVSVALFTVEPAGMSRLVKEIIVR